MSFVMLGVPERQGAGAEGGKYRDLGSLRSPEGPLSWLPVT